MTYILSCVLISILYYIQALWYIVGAIILLGNVKFEGNEQGLAHFSDSGESTANISKVIIALKSTFIYISFSPVVVSMPSRETGHCSD